MTEHAPGAIKPDSAVAEMFGRIVRRYDLMNRLMTGGMDVRWRRKAVTAARGAGDERALDVATGTGDLAIALADGGYREVIEGNLALAQHLAARLAAVAEIQVLGPQSLSIVCFRYVPPSLGDEKERINAFNERILERVQLGGEAFITGTNIDGIFWMRACIVNYRTTTAHIDALVELILRLAREESARGA